MSTFRITVAGGIFPAILPRSLPNDAAQVASNLHAGSVEFRPLPLDEAVATSPISAPKTLYRMARTVGGAFNTQMTTGWITSPDVVHYVKSQIDDDLTERTYFTTADGSQPPRATDVTGVTRLLGLKAPASQPVVIPTIVGEFTVQDRDRSLQSATASVVKAIQDNLIEKWVGADQPHKPGYLNNQDGYAGDAVQPEKLRVYRTGSLNGAHNGHITNTYSPGLGPEAFSSWAYNPVVGPRWLTATHDTPGWVAWAPGANPDFIGVPYFAYGRTYLVGPGLSAALHALVKPGTSEPLMAAPQVSALTTQVAKWVGENDARATDKVLALKNKVTALESLLDGGTLGGIKSVREAFYARPETQQHFDRAITSIAGAIFDRASRVSNSLDTSGSGVHDGSTGGA